ncbi:MAG: glutathione S-transferase family protein [Alphaproteobacteria bacterium]
MIQFYDVPFSPFAQKVKLALLEKGLDYETPPAELGPDTPMKAVNPRGEVPALVDEGLAIFDSSIILEYLEDRYPETPLRPADAAGRARARMIEEVCDSQFEAVNWGLNEIIGFKRADGDLAARILARASAEAAQLQGWLEGQLGGADWFNGATFGYGDIAVWPYVQTASIFKRGPAEGSALAAWHGRMAERASVQRTIAEVKQALPLIRELGAKFTSGQAARQFRDHRLEFMLRAGGAEVVTRGLENGTIRFSTLPG